MADLHNIAEGYLHDQAVHHQIGIIRLTNGMVHRIAALLNVGEAQIVELLRGTRLTDLGRERLQRLLTSLRAINIAAHGQALGALEPDLYELAAYEVDWQRSILDAIVKTGTVWESVSPEQLRAIATSAPMKTKLLRDWFVELAADKHRKLAITLQQGLLQGQTNDQIVQAIRGTRAARYQDGIFEVSRRSAEAVVRTAANHVANRARADFYEANAPIVGRWRFTATLDARTTLICASNDGKTFEIGKGPRPPLHINCRSTQTPIIENSLIGFVPTQRASVNGPVSADMNFEQWLSRQNLKTQKEVLGDTRYRLWQQGNLSLDSFVNDKNKVYTLDELRRREREAFTAIGE